MPSDARFAPNSDRKSGLPRKVMSALLPKADMCSAKANVCFGPIADKKPMFAMPAAPPKMASVATTDHCQIEYWALRPMVSFKPKDPQFRSRVEQSFDQQQVMKTLGVKILSLQPGEIELMMPYVAAYTQHGFHACPVS
jgi:hypothetical protein